MIRTILGGFLFEADDVFKKVAVLSAGEEPPRLAKMLLKRLERPRARRAHEHLDLDSRGLLDALGLRRDARVRVHDRFTSWNKLPRRSSRWAAARPRSTPGVRGLPLLEEAAGESLALPPTPRGSARTWMMHGVRRHEGLPRWLSPQCPEGPGEGRSVPAPASPKTSRRPLRRPPLAPRLRPTSIPPERRFFERELKKSKARSSSSRSGSRRRSRRSGPRGPDGRAGFYDDRARAAQPPEDHQSSCGRRANLMARWSPAGRGRRERASSSPPRTLAPRTGVGLPAPHRLD